tara:strand:- start:1596 stop:2171 length:576 start_codon:yes stop_codon:yes gene_type:complete
MSSEIKVSSVKAKDGTAGISIADSTGNVSLSGSLSAGTIGGNVVFPSGHIVQAVYNPTLSNTNTSVVSTNTDTGRCDITGQITITSGNHVLIYCQCFVTINANTNSFGVVSIYQGTSASLGTQISRSNFGLGSDSDNYCPVSFWAYDSNPQDATTPDYAIAISRGSGSTTHVEMQNFTSPDFQFYLFEVKA